MTIVDSLNQIWNTILETMALFVIPDWNAIIGLLPILIFLGVVGPLITFTFLGIFVYQVRKPRVKGVRFEEGASVAQIGDNGQPIFPPGLPHCRRDALVYASGTIRCGRCHDEPAGSVQPAISAHYRLPGGFQPRLDDLVTPSSA